MRSLLILIAFLFVAAPQAEAEIIAVYFKSDKVAKKYKKHLVEWQGQPCVVGEIMKGIEFTDEGVKYVSGGPNELFVADPSKPAEPAYYFLDGKKHPTSKKNRLVIQGNHIGSIGIMMRDETLAGLAKEYVLRMAQLDEFGDDRDQYDKGSNDWNSRHARLISGLEKMRMWLESTAFPGALKKIDKRIKKEKKYSTGHIEARAKAGQDSIKTLEAPAVLAKISEDKFKGEHKFHSMESMHLRFYYINTITDEQVRQALALGEEVIEGFRNSFIDPYLTDTYLDEIPETVFREYLFVPDTDDAYMAYTSGLWNTDWSQNREERLQLGSSSTGMGTFRLAMRENKVNLPGVVCHTLGHDLAAIHYGGGKIKPLPQAWLNEAVGLYISFEHLGTNSLSCKAFHNDSPGYEKREFEEKAEGEKSMGTGRRDTYNEVALQFGRPIDQLALKILFEMDDADLAKSWSFYDYIARKEGKQGQLWLQAAGKYSKDKKTFIQKWREAAAAALGVEPRDAFHDVEKRWRAFAAGDQDTSDKAGKKKKKRKR